MNEVHVLLNSDGAAIGAFTDKVLLEDHVACPCEDECEYCESLAAAGKGWSDGELCVDTVELDALGFIDRPKDSRENSNLNQVHVLSNGFGEILGVFTDKAMLEKSVAYPPEDKCQYCAVYESRGEVCPYKQSFIDTVDLDDPSLIRHFKERIAQVRAGIRESTKPCTHLWRS